MDRYNKNSTAPLSLWKKYFSKFTRTRGNNGGQRLNRKTANWMMVFISKFHRAGKLVFNTRSSTLTTANNRIHLPMQNRPHGFEDDTVYFLDDLFMPVKLYSKLVFCKKSGTAGREEAVEENIMFVKERAALALRRIVDSWTVQTESVLMQILLVHIYHFLMIGYEYGMVLKNHQHIFSKNGLGSGADISTP